MSAITTKRFFASFIIINFLSPSFLSRRGIYGKER
jgi:hypothetical protein